MAQPFFAFKTQELVVRREAPHHQFLAYSYRHSC
jgi:hypothetical protein